MLRRSNEAYRTGNVGLSSKKIKHDIGHMCQSILVNQCRDCWVTLMLRTHRGSFRDGAQPEISTGQILQGKCHGDSFHLLKIFDTFDLKVLSKFSQYFWYSRGFLQFGDYWSCTMCRIRGYLRIMSFE